MNKIEEIVISKFVDKIINSSGDWDKGFEEIKIPAMNINSKTIYTGVNALILENFIHKYETPFYLTAKQINEEGMVIKKGSIGHGIYFFKKSENEKDLIEKDDENDIEEDVDLSSKNKYIFRYYNVFNIDQVEKADKYINKYKNLVDEIIKSRFSNKSYKENDIVKAIKEYIKEQKIDFKERAHTEYAQAIDKNTIVMPLGIQYNDELRYIKTMLHELSHCKDKYFKKREDREIFAESTALFSIMEIKNIYDVNIKLEKNLINESMLYLKDWGNNYLKNGNINYFKKIIEQSINETTKIVKGIKEKLGINEELNKNIIKEIINEYEKSNNAKIRNGNEK